MSDKKLIGPFKQILTMQNLPSAGPISDDKLEIISNGGILIVEDKIERILSKDEFEKEVSHAKFHGSGTIFHKITENAVAMPGMIDCHTHMCYAGTRAEDYARRLSGETYLNIAKSGGGMLDTVRKTRNASEKELFDNLFIRGLTHLHRGVTTCEVKSGYGLTVEAELKMLEVINQANRSRALLPDLIPTCLAAHTCPPEFQDPEKYLQEIMDKLLPVVKEKNLANRVDIFIEESAFSPDSARKYLNYAKELGFQVIVHGDQFTMGGSEVAADVGALSAEHLEVSDEAHLRMLKEANVIAVALPGASLGLGIDFAPARKMLDVGLNVAISSDWNPGSAPMGELLTQAALLGAYQKLTIAETLAGITKRAADALSLNDRGVLAQGKLADFIAFNCNKYQEIVYNQGSLKPFLVYRKGKQIV
ncbi:MAG: imidazolonepropionase [Candidatus Lokiarchaeota archaeon]|nr:imidazolonepropionase [Candidatus Harpocratesius repetitus]